MHPHRDDSDTDQHYLAPATELPGNGIHSVTIHLKCQAVYLGCRVGCGEVGLRCPQRRAEPEAARLKRQNLDVAAKLGELRANSIRAHGKYVVGHDIKSGTWHTVGDGGASGSQCAYLVFSSVGKPSIPNFFDGPWTVNLSGAYGFVIYGPCTWIREP